MGDRWVEFRGVDGWEGYSVRVQARLRHGEAKVTGLVVEALSDSSPGLTGQRLRRLPVLDLAREALIYLPPEPAELIGARPVHEILAELSPAERDQLRKNLRQGPRSRAAVPLDDFVKAWRAALNDPRRSTGVRAAVCAELGISTRTYDRYRNQAEAIPGLAPTREENSK
jgi:hypothetical protein